MKTLKKEPVEDERRGAKHALIVIAFIIMYFLLVAWLMSCSSQKAIGQSTENKDSVLVRVVPVASLKGVKLAVGDSLSIPDMDIEIVRFSEKEAIVKTPIRTEIKTEFVPVENKTVYKNSFNQKSETNHKDKSKTKSVNRESEKTKIDNSVDNSKKTRSGFPNWVLLVIVLLVAAGIAGRWIIKRQIPETNRPNRDE